MRSNAQVAKSFKIHMSQSKGGGSIISFETGSVEFSRRVIDSLHLFKLTVSFGSCNSLCEMPSTLSHASIPAHKRTIPDDLIRLSVGIEDVNDLLEDLQQALTHAASSTPLAKRERSTSMHTTRIKPDLPAQVAPALYRTRRRSSKPILYYERNVSQLVLVTAMAFVSGIVAASFITKKS